MNILINYPVSYTPAVHPSAFRQLACPPVVACPTYPTLNFVAEPSDRWNCNLCGGDLPYVSLFKAGDIIPLQFNLPDSRNINNTGTLTPQVGWRQTDLLNPFWYIRAEVFAFDDCDTPIFELVDRFCADWWVGYSDKVGAVQTLFVDTSQIVAAGVEAFYIKITTVDDALADAITLYSEPFIADTCKDTLLFQSNYANTDCENRDYRNPTDSVLNAIKVPFTPPVADSLTPFYASWRFEATIKATGYSSEATINDNDIVTRQKLTDSYEIAFFPLAPYAAKIANAIIRGRSVTVDGVEYENFGDIAQNLEGRNFLPVVSCQRVCKIDNLGCD